MSCPDCAVAQHEAHWGGYRAACRGCQVRALANGLALFRSIRAGCKLPEYKQALENVFGEEGAAAGHELVKAERLRLTKLRRSTKS